MSLIRRQKDRETYLAQMAKLKAEGEALVAPEVRRAQAIEAKERELAVAIERVKALRLEIKGLKAPATAEPAARDAA